MASRGRCKSCGDTRAPLIGDLCPECNSARARGCENCKRPEEDLTPLRGVYFCRECLEKMKKESEGS